MNTGIEAQRHPDSNQVKIRTKKGVTIYRRIEVAKGFWGRGTISMNRGGEKAIKSGNTTMNQADNRNRIEAIGRPGVNNANADGL